MNRKSFIKNAGLITAGLSLADIKSFATPALKNALPRWKGFNLLDFFLPILRQTGMLLLRSI